jgi:glycosyltransferase involved in cell wall biosynthesis
MYLFHLRNIDIGIAPLARNIFNMSKSDIKPVEYALWGTPAVLPNFVTYNRTWKNNETCLLYDNDREFKECMETMINDHELRTRLGAAAKKYVQENRLERQHSEKRYKIYRDLIDRTHRLKVFTPEENING